MIDDRLETIEITHNSDEWYDFRRQGVGGSDAACIFGLSPWKSVNDLWAEKTGRKQPKDNGNADAKNYGKNAENYLSRLFALDFPEYEVLTVKDKVYKRGFMFASLDGELVDKNTGKKGILEIKTASINSRLLKDKWDKGVPDNYYIQILHYLAVTGYDFAVLKARLKDTDKDGKPFITVKHYFFDRQSVSNDIDLLVDKETKFWECVEKKRRPPVIIPNL